MNNVLKVVGYGGSVILFFTYHIHQTCKTVNRVVNYNVLDREKKHPPEYIYIDDPSYINDFKMEQDKQRRQFGLFNFLKSLRYSLAWRLLWLCRHGNREQRNIALVQLASFKNNKDWDCVKLAQAMDKNTAVLLARTEGADTRYFLPPPIHVRRAALSPELISFKFRDLLTAVENVNPHSCIQYFICKHFVNIQEQAMEADNIPTKPDSISERDLCLLCLDALNHHISIFYTREYVNDISIKTLINLGLLSTLAETLLRNKGDHDLDLAVLRILTVLSIHKNLLKEFFENGLICELSRLLKSTDVRLASSAAVCLANLSGEHTFRPGLYLLHPLYRTTKPHICDTLLVHGLRGGVFVTWRQRDRKCTEPHGIIEVTMSDECALSERKLDSVSPFLDPEMKEAYEDLKEFEEQTLLSEYEVVLHDIPTQAKRDSITMRYTASEKYSALEQEISDNSNYTSCWPKDWLPKDCGNLRILGVNYWSSLSDWFERCPLQSAEISVRASEFAPSLIDAGVGSKDVPIVWLTHSMGGLIVKQILIEGAQTEKSELHKLCKNTKAVLFYSTPHKGSALATMPRTAAAILWPSNDVRQLQENSPVLLDIHKTFIHLADIYGWETISFAESVPTLVTAFKVPVHFVDANSADLGRGVFYQLPLDHLAICKPATRQSILYTTVVDVLHRVTTKGDESRYTNPFLKWFQYVFYFIFSQKHDDVIDSSFKETSQQGLRWFEKMILDSFTDF